VVGGGTRGDLLARLQSTANESVSRQKEEEEGEEACWPLERAPLPPDEGEEEKNEMRGGWFDGGAVVVVVFL
jgi:hypothetical protein